MFGGTLQNCYAGISAYKVYSFKIWYISSFHWPPVKYYMWPTVKLLWPLN